MRQSLTAKTERSQNVINTAKLQTTLCDDGLKMLEDMQGEEKQETFSDFLFFN